MKDEADYYWPLFNHMEQEHGRTLVASEMNEIILIVKRMIADKLSTKITDFIFEMDRDVKISVIKHALKEIIEKP